MTEPRHRILLDRLPKLLRGYGKSLQRFHAAVVVVVDLDKRDCRAFKKELLAVLNKCTPRPNTLIRIAIEEMEAWLLGDPEAIRLAYPEANSRVLKKYRPDQIIGTWELLADAVHPGGAKALRSAGWPAPGEAKCAWAEAIAPHIEIARNGSPSFKAFRDGLLRLAG